MAGTGGATPPAPHSSSGPSGSYGGKVASRATQRGFRKRTRQRQSGAVRLAPDGTIVGTPQLVKTSGLPGGTKPRAWQKTEKLPRGHVDGTVPPRLIVTLRPALRRSAAPSYS
jgi:colicin import membrane protein